MNQWWKIVVSIFIIIGLVACSNDADEETQDPAESLEIEITEEEIIDEDKEVIRINGTAVKGDKYNHIYPQIKAQAIQLEEEVDQDELVERTIDALIERELMLQEAEEEGIVVSAEDVTKEFDTIKTVNEEGLSTLLEQFHLSEEAFKEQLKFELTLDMYAKEIVEPEVTDEEIKEYYDLIKEQNEDIPELEELRVDIESQIQQQKSLEEIQDILVEKRENADIERNI